MKRYPPEGFRFTNGVDLANYLKSTGILDLLVKSAVEEEVRKLRVLLDVLSNGARAAGILAVESTSANIRVNLLLGLVEELRRTHSTIVKAIGPLRRIPDNEKTFADDFRLVYADFREFYDVQDFFEARTHCQSVERSLTRLKQLDPSVVQTKEWPHLELMLSGFVNMDWDLILQHYMPFMKQFNEIMIGMHDQIESGQIVKAIRIKRIFLSGLGNQYDDIKEMLTQMTDTVAEIEKSLP